MVDPQEALVLTDGEKRNGWEIKARSRPECGSGGLLRVALLRGSHSVPAVLSLIGAEVPGPGLLVGCPTIQVRF